MHAYTHPLASHAPRTVLGYRADGRPVYPIAGGNGEGDPTPAPTGAPPAASAPQSPAAQEVPKPTPPAKPAEPTEDHAATIARLQKELADVRKEAAGARVAKGKAAEDSRNEITQLIGKALGLIDDNTPPDPAKLAEQISTQSARNGELEKQLRQRDVELAVHALAAKHGALASSLLDSRAFARAVAELDPTAKDFTDQLDAAIKTAVEQTPAFKAAPPAGRSGPDLTGGTGERGRARPTSLGAAISAAYQ